MAKGGEERALGGKKAKKIGKTDRNSELQRKQAEQKNP